jgi:hypothetical protein
MGTLNIFGTPRVSFTQVAFTLSLFLAAHSIGLIRIEHATHL